MEARVRLLRGSVEVHTAQSHAIIGTPCDVPVPKKMTSMTPACSPHARCPDEVGADRVWRIYRISLPGETRFNTSFVSSFRTLPVLSVVAGSNNTTSTSSRANG